MLKPNGPDPGYIAVVAGVLLDMAESAASEKVEEVLRRRIQENRV